MSNPSPPSPDHACPHAVSLRPASANDEAFVRQVYASTRQEEMQSWGWTAEQQQHFVRMQFDARRSAYAATYPVSVECVILDADVPAGSITVSRSSAEIRLVDIALLPEHRSRGIGTILLSMLTRESMSSDIPVRLSVVRGNPAYHLYERLGFVVTDAGPMYLEMEYRSHVTESF